MSGDAAKIKVPATELCVGLFTSIMRGRLVIAVLAHQLSSDLKKS